MLTSYDKPTEAAAEAIAVEAARLQRLALEHDLPFLAYLLEMVVLEAWREACGDAEASPIGPVSLASVRSG